MANADKQLESLKEIELFFANKQLQLLRIRVALIAVAALAATLGAAFMIAGALAL